MTPIRILLAQLPRMLLQIFQEILADEPDMEVVGEVGDSIEVLLAAGRTRADVVVLGMHGDGLPALAAQLLDESPHLKVLAVHPDGRRAFLYELRPHLIPVGQVSADGLRSAIRAAVRAETA